ncbi:MAG: TlpA disulfide reductase family protein [Bacteroidia bacterium]
MNRLKVFVSIFLLLIPFWIMSSCNNNDSGERTSKNTSGNDLSDIQLSNLDGTPFNLANLDGKAVFLNLWATWCKPCIAEMPSIESAYQQLKDSDIVFLLASDEALSLIQDFKNKHSYSFHFVQLESGLETVQSYALPTTILFNQMGKQISIERGAKDWDSPEEIHKLKELLNENN